MGLAFCADCCCCLPGFGEELYKDWDNHPAAQQYTFIKQLGEGGFSEVQLAKDDLTGKTVALKIVFLNKSGLKPDERRILSGEAKLLRMVAHPNIVRCMRVLETKRQQVLVLEHLSGGEMLQQLQRVKRYSEAHACQLFRQVVDAVAYLHSLGIMHRDIKPENCLLAKPAQYYKEHKKPVKVKLIDLGMAGLYRPKKPLYGCMGSPGFIAPEVVLGDAHTPAMDMYSLGVLLFIMLVGRKPWDSQRSHTLQYAVLSSADAPGLSDPIFRALSAGAKQLLLTMLHEDHGQRPSAEGMLSHPWMLQKRKASGDDNAAAATERLIQPAVQQRLLLLENSRQIMGTARGMMLLHSRGSQAGAVAFHRAVKEARLKLQQQAAALKATGQLPELEITAGDALFAKKQTDSASAACTTVSTINKVAYGLDVNRVAAVNCIELAQAPVATPRSTVSTDGGKIDASSQPNLARPVSYADPLSAAAQPTAGNSGITGAPLKHRRNCSVGELARASLQQQSLLFTGLQRPPAVQAAGTASAAAGSGGKLAAGTTVGVGGHFEALDAALVVEALNRGMSVPNPELVTQLSCQDNSNHRKCGRAVSLSPGALALLDVDDQLCLLAAGTSADDDENDGMALFSWASKRGAADMVASFKQRYPAKPMMKTLAKLGHSLSTSLSRSFRNTAGGLLGSYRSGRYSPTRLASAECPEANPSGSISDGHAGTAAGPVPLLSAAGASDMPQHMKRSSIHTSSVDHGQSGSAGIEDSSADPVRSTADSSKQVLPQLPTRHEGDTTQQHVAQSLDASHHARRQPGPAGVLEGGSPADELLGHEGASTGGCTGPGGLALVNSSRGCSIDLALLGPMMSMSPPRSPPTATPGAEQADKRLCDLRSAEATASVADGNTQFCRPPPAAAAAAANKHFNQHYRQRAVESELHLQAVVPGVSEATVPDASSGAKPAAQGAQGGDSYSQQQLHEQQLGGKLCEINPFRNGAKAADLSSVTPESSLARRVSRQCSNSLAGNHILSTGTTSNISISLSAAPIAVAGNSKALLLSPSIRAAATAAATAAEEEGSGLPNGLWLQQSQSLSSAGALSPALYCISGLGLELTAARTLSSVVASPKGLLTQDSMLDVTFAEQQLSGNLDCEQTQVSTITATGPVARPVKKEHWQQGATAVEQDECEMQCDHGQSGASSMQNSSRHRTQEVGSSNISVTDWVELPNDLQAWQVAEDVRGISVVDWIGSGIENLTVGAVADSSSTSCSGPAAAGGSCLQGSQPQLQSRSRHVAVPHGHSIAGGRQCPVRHSRPSSSHKHGRWKPAISTEDDSGDLHALIVAADATAEGAGSATLAGDGSAVSADAEEGVRHSRSAGEEAEQEQNFYVGSFHDAFGLGDGQQLRYANRLSADESNSELLEDTTVDGFRQAAALTAAPGKMYRPSMPGQEEDRDPMLLIGLEESLSLEQPSSAEPIQPVALKGAGHRTAGNQHRTRTVKDSLNVKAAEISKRQKDERYATDRYHVKSQCPTFDEFDEPTSWYYAK